MTHKVVMTPIRVDEAEQPIRLWEVLEFVEWDLRFNDGKFRARPGGGFVPALS